MRIDAHQHFWKLSRGDYPWPNETVAPIFRDFGPADLEPHLTKAKIAKTVLVQATDSVAETDFLLDIADKTQNVAGVVGWVDLSDPNASETVKRFSKHPRFKGVRPMLQNIDQTDWILQPTVVENLRVVAQLGLRMDALILPRHLEVTAELAKMIPTLTIVIDHCAKPVIMDDADAGNAWRDGMADLAKLSNVYCKISGLANEAGPSWSAKGLKPITDHIIAHFGAEKTMWGSDWPVLNLVGDYHSWVGATDDLLVDISASERAAILGETAAKFYDLELSE